jgi:MscS family membrane protein
MDNQSLLNYIRPLIEVVGDNTYLQALTAVVIAFAVASLISLLISKVFGSLVRKTNNLVDDAIARYLRIPVYWTVIQFGFLAALTILQLPPTPTLIIRNVIVSLLIMIWSLFLTRTLRLLIQTLSNYSKRQSLIRPQTLPLFDNIVIIAVVVLSLYFVFEVWNIDMTAWLASAGIIGIAMGFAAKDTLANLFSGVFIFADSPYKIGDYVVLDNGTRGKVTHIGLRSTRILTRDDVEVTIPNAIIANTRVINESGGPYEKFRIRAPISAAYGSDIDQVKNVLLQIAADEAEVSANPSPRVRFRSFGASGLEFELLCWVDKPEWRGRVLDALNTAIYKRFMAEGIEIPYSKHDVFIKGMPSQSMVFGKLDPIDDLGGGGGDATSQHSDTDRDLKSRS